MHRENPCRRTHARYPLDAPLEGTITFGYPRPQDPPCILPLRDISQSGLGFMLRHELPGLEVGDGLQAVEIRLLGRVIRGDLLIMHFTPDVSPGSVCGALFYPGEDVDLLALRACLTELETAVSEREGVTTLRR